MFLARKYIQSVRINPAPMLAKQHVPVQAAPGVVERVQPVRQKQEAPNAPSSAAETQDFALKFAQNEDSPPAPTPKIDVAPLVQEIAKELGPFVFDESADGADVERRAPMVLENGAVYEGEWSKTDDVRHGHGKLIFPDGALFEGTWREGKVNGNGRHIHSNGEYYIGGWKDDAVHGYGKLVHTDGASYEGMWEHDKQNGKGVEKWPDGAEFKGIFVDGLKTGKGKFNWADGSYYKGNFKNNCIEGFGKYFWADGR
jgi:hypothetical protein